MGASSSRIEEDKALQLCRARKKFVKQALNGRCSVAATHIAYIEALKGTGIALRKFVEPEGPVESSIVTPTAAAVEPHVLTKIASQLSFSSTPHSQHLDSTSNISPSSSPASSRFQANHMKFRGTFSRKVEEKPSVPVTVSVTSSTPEKPVSDPTEQTETSAFETPPVTPPWDYFGLSHPIDNHFSSQEGAGSTFNPSSNIKQQKEDEGVSEFENEEDKLSFKGREDSDDSEDEFDVSSTATQIRSFENINRSTDPVTTNDLPTTPSGESGESEIKFFNEERTKSPDLLPLQAAAASGGARLNNIKIKPLEQDDDHDKVAPKDFFSSMKDIERLFSKASDSGREVPRMLEANKFHFRPIVPGKERGSMASTLLKSCFSCGDDPSEVKEEPPQTSVKYLTWHRTTSSRSSSSRNLGGANTIEDLEYFTNNIFENIFMAAGSHASTLDRLHAWEKKLYDEVKASEMIRREYDLKCRLLRQLESRGESRDRIDKTRAVIKDLHTRIRVAIHRIDSVSKKIEELRDKELQPQLKELIGGLRKMWEVMHECHKGQLHIISITRAPGRMKISIQSDSKRQITLHLSNELNFLASSFTKWIGSQKAYVEFINKWLFKCVSINQKSSRRKRRLQPPPLRKHGPPIYATCGAWLDKFETLPTKDVVDSIKELASEISHLLPRQEKKQGKGANDLHAGLLSNEAASQERASTGLDNFRASLVYFLSQLNNFAEKSVEMYTDLQLEILEAKKAYEQTTASSLNPPSENL